MVTQVRGLTAAEVEARRAGRGNRERPRPRPLPLRGAGALLLRPLGVVLLLIAAVYAVIGGWWEAAVVMVVLVLTLAVEIGIRLRARNAVGTLARLAATKAQVWRDGELREIPIEDLVSDDMVVLVPGSRVPADLRLLEAERLLLDESSISGESQPVGHVAGGDVRAGARVLRGRATGVVTATGAESALGRIAGLVGETGPGSTPVGDELRRLVPPLVAGFITASILVGVIGFLRGQPGEAMLLGGLTLAFASMPAELPLLALIVLGLGSLRLSRWGVVVRSLGAAEMLGEITLVCTDKTGTLTQNRAELDRVQTSEEVIRRTVGEGPEQVLRLARLASEPPADDNPRGGDPIDAAVWASAPGDWPLPNARFAFDESRRIGSALADIDGSLILAAKGAPEAILVRCRFWRQGNQLQAMKEPIRAGVLNRARDLADEGTRVLAVASRIIDSPIKGGAAWLERDLVFEGLIAFTDPLRPEVPGAMHELFRGGVGVTMITGDQPATAQAVARPAGLSGPVFISIQTRHWSDQELAERASEGAIFARARPEDKLRIVHAAAAAGEVVAVTGDGVNDAPALEAAALGVAMGKSGSDAARDVSDLILENDDFSVLARAIAEGRRLYQNVGKAVRYYLAVKLALVGVCLAMVALGLPLPFTPLQIIAMELVGDVGAAVAFTHQPSEADEMRRRPRRRGHRVVAGATVFWVVAGGITLGVLCGLTFYFGLHLYGVAAARTLTLVSWLVGHATLGAVLARERRDLPIARMLDNRAMLLWLAAAVVLAVVGAAVTPVREILQSGRAMPLAVAAAMVASATVPWWLEFFKGFQRRI
ncbi:MAG TPA: HAD-IC family P-type ATPase [Candidatus Dormibacteraeota bacterium]|jgi:Ca2+-transporting ATPase|nr:HAD-IC family P-type ATPase [Candidatus Dormibacteraeota bacterium]